MLMGDPLGFFHDLLGKEFADRFLVGEFSQFALQPLPFSIRHRGSPMSKKEVRHEMNLVELVDRFSSDNAARAYLEKLRWPDGIACPRCGDKTISRLKARDQFDCDSCRYQFSVTSGTVMHKSKLPLWKWFLAAYTMVESKKGVSANQIKRELRTTYKTAWLLCHRIRAAMSEASNSTPLMDGVIEIDDT